MKHSRFIAFLAYILFACVLWTMSAEGYEILPPPSPSELAEVIEQDAVAAEVHVVAAGDVGEGTVEGEESNDEGHAFVRIPRGRPLTYAERYLLCSQAPDRPTSISQLTDGYSVFYYSLSEDEAVELSLIGVGEMARHKKSGVLVHRFFQYKKDICVVNGELMPIAWGAGTELVAHIRKASKRATLSGLPSIAASVTLGFAEVNYRLDVAGVTGEPIRAALPDGSALAGKFGVEGYGVVTTAADKVRRLMSAQGVTVTPQLVFLEWGQRP